MSDFRATTCPPSKPDSTPADARKSDAATNVEDNDGKAAAPTDLTEPTDLTDPRNPTEPTAPTDLTEPASKHSEGHEAVSGR